MQLGWGDEPEHRVMNTALPPTARPPRGSRPDVRHWGARRPNRWPTEVARDGQHLISLRPHRGLSLLPIFFGAATKPVNLSASPPQESHLWRSQIRSIPVVAAVAPAAVGPRAPG